MLEKVLFLLLAMSASMHAQANPGKTKPKRHEPSSGPTASDFQALKDVVTAQQAQIQQLSQQLKQRDEQWAQFQQEFLRAKEAANQAKAQAVSAETSSEQANTAVVALKTDVNKVQSTVGKETSSDKELEKRIGGIEGVLSRFRAGDIRLRSDSIFQTYQGCAACVDRNRARIRMRLGLEGKLGEDFIGGMYVASGANLNGVASLADPISTNETLTTFFERNASSGQKRISLVGTCR
jgi:uncharacterized protein YPO0396